MSVMTTTKRHALTVLALAVLICIAALIGTRTHNDVPSVDTHDARVSVSMLLPACEYEDASGPNDMLCVWDASTAGIANGGDSFIAYRDASGCVVTYYYGNGPTDSADICGYSGA